MIEDVLEFKDFPQNHFSVTQLNTFLRCPAQYYFRYVEGLKIPPSGAITKGVCVHSAIEHNYKQKIETHKDLPLSEVTEYAAYKFEELAPDTDWGDEKPGEAKDDTINLTVAYHKLIAPKVQPIASEKEFVIPLDGDINLLAYVDVIDNKKRIRDTKTASRKPGQDVADKSLQLSAYALCYREVFGEEESEVVLDYVVSNKKKYAVESIKSKRTKRDLDRFKTIALGVIRAIKNKVFYPNPTNYLCNDKFCGYYHLCKKVF